MKKEDWQWLLGTLVVLGLLVLFWTGTPSEQPEQSCYAYSACD